MQNANMPSTDTLSWEDAMKELLQDRQIQRLAPRTIQLLKEQISRAGKDLDGFGVTSPTQVTETIMRQYFKSLSKKRSSNTQALRRYSLQKLMDYLVRSGKMTSNPVACIPKPKQLGIVQPRAVADEDLWDFFTAPDPETYIGKRDRAILWLMFDTGMSRGEICGLTIGDLDLARGCIHVRHGSRKTHHARAVPVSATVRNELAAYLEVRPKTKNPHLFVTAKGEPLTPDALDNRFVQYSKRTGIKVTPRMLRDSFALNYLRLGGDMQSLQRLLGLRSRRTAQTYKMYMRSGWHDLVEKHRRFSPGRHLYEELERQ